MHLGIPIYLEEVNAMQDEILDKSRMIDAVSKEREEVIKALEDKKVVEEKLRKSGNNSMLKIVDLEDELTNTKQLVCGSTKIHSYTLHTCRGYSIHTLEVHKQMYKYTLHNRKYFRLLSIFNITHTIQPI